MNAAPMLRACPPDDQGVVAWFHEATQSVRGSGDFEVRRGRTPMARLLARLLGLPHQGRNVPITVRITRQGDREIWERSFAGRLYVTEQIRQGPIRLERIGPIRLRFRLEPGPRRLFFRHEGSSLLVRGIAVKLPAFLAPRFSARAEERGEDAFCVTVRISVPIAGPLLTYRGIVRVEEET
jgi:Domain of unknown function (DUF4166)